MSSLAKTNFQEMSFLDEMIDQVIILDKSRNVCCANTIIPEPTIIITKKQLPINSPMKILFFII